MKRIIFFIALLSIYSFVFVSCQKEKENKLAGTWKYVFLSNVSNTSQTWSFTNDGKFTRTILIDTISSCDTAEWSLSAKLFAATTIKIQKLDEWTNGTYKVLTLSKKYLIIQRIFLENGDSKGAFKRMEFVKSK